MQERYQELPLPGNRLRAKPVDVVSPCLKCIKGPLFH